MPEIRHVFLDLDGVLIDTEPLYSRFWREAVASLGYSMSLEESLALRSLDNRLARERFAKQYGRDLYDELREKRKSLMEEYRAEHPIRAKEGAAELMEWLKEGELFWYIVTASPLDRAERYMKEAGLPWNPKRILSTKSVERGKPFPDAYLEARRIAGAGEYEAVAVEDSPNGVRSASAAKCLPLMVPDLTPPAEEDLPFIWKVCNSLTELPSLFQ